MVFMAHRGGELTICSGYLDFAVLQECFPILTHPAEVRAQVCPPPGCVYVQTGLWALMYSGPGIAGEKNASHATA